MPRYSFVLSMSWTQSCAFERRHPAEGNTGAIRAMALAPRPRPQIMYIQSRSQGDGRRAGTVTQSPPIRLPTPILLCRLPAVAQTLKAWNGPLLDIPPGQHHYRMRSAT
jgi:hypothetical protein